MDRTDNDYYDEYRIRPWPVGSGEQHDDRDEASRSSSSVSKTFVIGVLAIAALLGFSLGLYSADSLSSNTPALFDEQLVTELFEQVSPAVVEITVTRTIGSLDVPRTGTGSGFIVDSEGHVVTNHHVIDGVDEVQINLSDGRSLAARVLGSSPADDLALLQVNKEEIENIAPLHLADSGEVKPGQMAVAIGSPFRNFNSVTVGVVSGTGRGPTSTVRRPIPDMIQTDAALNPGNSGGPLLDVNGDVIGVNSAVRTGNFRGLGDYRIGFAVPSNTVKNLMPDLMLAREIKRPWLGISGGPISTQLADDLGITEGIVVTAVFPDSPAEKAGLVPFRSLTSRGDVITAVDGVAVSDVEEMVALFNGVRPGHETTLTIFRKGRTLDVKAMLAEWPDT